ncbi:MAG: phage tail tape measure protein [Candidatus Omnitrophica bacterium]|nr:phage tail tape measure protein [Candidatus Omnitrophota bacterium]
MSSGVHNVTEPLAKAADSVLKLDAALAALVIGGMALAIRKSEDFNQGFALISTSVDASGKDLLRYRDDVLSYATGSTKSLADINAALYTAAQAGVKWGESLDFMRASEQLAVANSANLNTTVDLLTGTMNAYGFTLSDVGHLNDVFFTSTLIGKQTIDELGQSMGNVVGIAANFGVSFEDLSAAITTLTAKGMDTANAITAVKGVITTIVSPSAEAAAAAKELGLTFSASELKAKGLDTMLRSVMQATGGNADTMAKLFTEVRALNGIMQLTGDGMEFFKKALDQINNSAGSAEGAYQKMSITFKNQTQMIANTATVLMIDVGTRLEATGAEIGGSFGDLLKGIKIGVDEGAFDPLFAALSEAGGALSAWVSGVARALPDALQGLDFSKLVSSLRDLGGAFGDWFGAMDLTKVEDLHDFIQGLIDGISGLVRVTEGMVDGFRPFFTAISDFLISVADSDEETQKMTGTILALSSMVEKAGLGFVVAIKVIDEYGLSISGVFNVIAGGAQIMWNGLQLLANSIQALFVIVEGALLKFVDMLSFGLLGKYNETFRNLISSVEESGKNVSKSIMENGVDAGRGLDKMIEGFKTLGEQSGKTGKEVSQAGDEIGKIPEKKKTLWQFEGADEIRQSIVDIGKEFVTTGEKAEKSLPKNEERNIIVGYIEDENGRREITQKIKTAVPDEKKIDVKMNDAAIKEQAKTIATALEWKAKVDIAQAQESAKILVAAFGSLNTGITSTGTLLGGLFNNLEKANAWNRDIIEDQIKMENERRQKEFDAQQKIIEQQIQLNELKLKRYQEGNSAISISAEGLQPHLEMILWEILEKIQIRANESGAEFLLGM